MIIIPEDRYTGSLTISWDRLKELSNRGKTGASATLTITAREEPEFWSVSTNTRPPCSLPLTSAPVISKPIDE